MVGINDEIVRELVTSETTEENIQKYLGILEETSLEKIREFASMLAEYLFQEHGGQNRNKNSNKDIIKVSHSINDLKNIITYENANIMNKFKSWKLFQENQD